MSLRAGVSRRALVLYLGTIVGPTLVLLVLGLQSVYRQRQALDHLTLANVRLSGERAAADVERRVAQAVDECLRDPRVAAIVREATSLEDPGAARTIRAEIDAVRHRHPIASHLFVLDYGRVRYPILRSLFPAPIEALLEREPATSRLRVAALVEKASASEAAGSWSAAADAYAACAEAARAPAVRALALLREARCRDRMRDPARAIELYAAVGERFGDEFDPSWRPAALAAGVEGLRLLTATGHPAGELAARLRADLARGRWEVSAEQFAYFDGELARLAPATASRDGDSAFARELQLAQAFEQQFQPAAALRPLDARPFVFSAAGSSHQAYYAVANDNPTRPVVVLVLDLSLVERIVREAARRAAVVQPVALAVGREGVRDGSTRIDVPFPPPAFPHWVLSIEAPAAIGRLSRDPRNLALFAGATLLILTVLVLGVVLLVRDVARESAMNRLRGDFVSGVSHELKTPLTVIRLYAENLRDDPDAPASERRRAYAVLTRESERLTRLIERVLRFSRADGQARDRASFRPLELVTLVREIVGAYGQNLRRRGFALDVSLDDEVPAVLGDPDAIADAVINLLDNAAKYSGEARRIRVSVARRAAEAVVEVQDHGVGIEAADQERIFDRFYRGAGTGKGGYGLGLFLVAQTMAAHEGRVELDSAPGRGSAFRLVFKLANDAITTGA